MEDIQQVLALRSLQSQQKVFIRIVNLTNRNVDIIWVNFTGEYVRYQQLPHKSFIDVNTYETHPWIAIDSEKKDRMLIDKQFIFMPKTWREYIRDRHSNLPVDFSAPNYIPRLLVTITIPVYSLRYRTLLEVRSYLKDESEVDSLDVPKQLQNDLKLLILERNRFPLFDS